MIVDNGSTDGSQELIRTAYPEVELIELGRNHGFGPALNRAIAATDGDPVVLVNNDVVCEPRFLEALLEPATAGAEMVAGVLLSERDPRLIDSAGVIADRTLMGFDYLNGERREVATSAPPPLGPTGGAALYSRAAFDAVGGFDERIFLYYEDLDLALRLRAGGAHCELAHEAAAVHAYSQTLGAASGAKYARTGWSRGYMLRRYGVMGHPRDALRVLAAEGAICAGQLLGDRSASGLRGRLRGWRDGRGLPRLHANPGSLPSSASERPWRCAEPGAGRAELAAGRQPAALPAQLGEPAQGFQLAACGRRKAPLADAPCQRSHLDRGDPRDRPRRHELELGREAIAGHQARVLGARLGKALLPDRVADVPDDRLGDQLEAPARDPRPYVEVDVLVEGDVALVVAAELIEQPAPQQAGRPADAERLTWLHPPASAWLPGALLDRPPVPGQRLAGTVDPRPAFPALILELEDQGLHAAQPGVGAERFEQPADAPGLQDRVGVEDEHRLRLGPPDPEVDRRREPPVFGQGHVWDPLALELLNRPVPRAVVDHHQLDLDPRPSRLDRSETPCQVSERVPVRDYHRDGLRLTHGSVTIVRFRYDRRVDGDVTEAASGHFLDTRENPHGQARDSSSTSLLIHSVGEFTQLIEHLISAVAPQRVIEIGGESGESALTYLAAGAEQVVCVDTSPGPELVRRAEEEERLDLVVARSPG